MVVPVVSVCTSVAVTPDTRYGDWLQTSPEKLTVVTRTVAVLVDETLPAGRHRAKWNAGGQPSSVYFLRLEVRPSTGSGQGLVETRKMTLVR